MSKVDERLKRLVESGICSCENVSTYESELMALSESILNSTEAHKKSKFFKALADPTRLKMLGLLSIREMCVCEIMVALGLTQPTASHHLGILENVDLVKSRKDGKWVFYSLINIELIVELRRLNIL